MNQRMQHYERHTPQSAEQLAAFLAHASAECRVVVPYGSGSHQYLAGALPDPALLLDTTGLGSVLAYAPADLTITVAAGVRLAQVQATLREHNQWLPWNPSAGAQATIGGLLASGQAGMLRLGYGTPRDWLLGARVALPDGRLVKSGGTVVKNVAGYDMHKLHLGAFGTLGVLTSATFKVAPLPQQLVAVSGSFATVEAALHTAEQLRQRPYAPVSLVLLQGNAIPGILPDQAGPLVLLAWFGGIAPAVHRHIQAAQAAGVGNQCSPVQQDHAWQCVADYSLPRPDDHVVVLRLGVRAARLGALIALERRYGPASADSLSYPGVGILYARWPVVSTLPQHLAALRDEVAQLGGYVVVESAPSELEPLDRWGLPPPGLPIMQNLKHTWDPQAILNPGRYLPGL